MEKGRDTRLVKEDKKPEEKRDKQGIRVIKVANITHYTKEEKTGSRS